MPPTAPSPRRARTPTSSPDSPRCLQTTWSFRTRRDSSRPGRRRLWRCCGQTRTTRDRDGMDTGSRRHLGRREQGFTVGFMTLHRPDGATLALKYLAYWVKQREGWRVVAYKRTRAGEGSPALEMMAPAVPSALVAPTVDRAAISRSSREPGRSGARVFGRGAEDRTRVRRSRSSAAPTPSIWAALPMLASSSAQRTSLGPSPAASRRPGAHSSGRQIA